jgi:hypothetical protein
VLELVALPTLAPAGSCYASVRWREFVIPFAVRLCLVERWHCCAAHDVLDERHWLEVEDVHAGTVLTTMINVKRVGQRSIDLFKEPPMCLDRRVFPARLRKVEPSVAFIGSATPDQAASALKPGVTQPHACEEPLIGWLGVARRHSPGQPR